MNKLIKALIVLTICMSGCNKDNGSGGGSVVKPNPLHGILLI